MNFLDLFPLPKFLKIPVIGFDISDKSIKYIQLEKNVGEFFIKQYGEKKLPEGIIEGGEIKKESDFIAFLKSNFGKIKPKNIIASLPEEKAFLDIIELPKMELKNIRQSLSVQLENYFPIKPEEAVFDYEILDSSQNFFDILVVAFPSRLVESYNNSLAASGFKPLIFELEAEALKECLSRKNDPPKMLVDFGKTRTSFVITARNKVLFTSTVKISGEDLDKAIQRSFSLLPEEAERVKKEKGRVLPFTGKQFQNQQTQEKEIQSILMPAISGISQEIEKYIAYWQTHYSHIHQKKQTNINEIILCGGDANFIGLSEYLSLTLKIPVKLANVWTNVLSFEKNIPEIEFNESLKFATAIGLALKGKNFL